MTPKGKILLVATNASKVPGIRRTVGAWLSEIVYFYDPITQGGFDVDIVSPKGGVVPLDPLGTLVPTGLNKTYLNDARFMSALAATASLRDVNSADYGGIYFAGGHGPIVDFPEDRAIQKTVIDIYEQGGAVGAVCHGPVALLNVKNRDGSFFIAGRQITGCSNVEEALIGLKHQVPFLLETEIKKRGGLYQKNAFPLFPKIVVSERLITGQNNFAPAKVAAEFLKILNREAVAMNHRVPAAPPASPVNPGTAS